MGESGAREGGGQGLGDPGLRAVVDHDEVVRAVPLRRHRLQAPGQQCDAVARDDDAHDAGSVGSHVADARSAGHPAGARQAPCR
ncbi:hypothetical protein GCM10025782_36860 [Pedococcus ginsenosidimutans]|uniref:Uncharacterized protein n=1 Tax=Pedococcus ginsenosidimutans TaxID=490570 RepID=A0ABP8YSD6_9MICO